MSLNIYLALSNLPMRKTNLLGVELGRGISTYAVVLVHSGDETWGIPIAPSAITFRLLFYFAVPFFLAAAFYFMIAKPDAGYSRRFWKSRFDRIVVPYAVWSLIFLVARIKFFVLSHHTGELQQLLQDPMAILFLGRSSYQLYFLPLLLVGTLLVLLMPLLERLKLNTFSLCFLSVLSIVPSYLMVASGNSFDLGNYTAFGELVSSWQIDLEQQPWIRFALVALAWLLLCLPYFAVTFTLNHLPSAMRQRLDRFHPVKWALLFMLFLFCRLVLREILSSVFTDLLLAFSLLLFCVSLSYFLIEHSWENSAFNNFLISGGTCSFGIYLCHPFTMNLVKPVLGKLLPELTASVSILSILLISIPSFLLSWVAVAWLSQHKAPSKYLFGA